MTIVKTFIASYECNQDTSGYYERLNEQINEYAEKNNLYIKNIMYESFERFSRFAILANVIFSTLPNELWLL